MSSFSFDSNLAFDIFDSIDRLSHSFKMKIGSHHSCAYNCGQGKLLRFLCDNGKSTLSEISSSLGITVASVSEAADKLLQADYIIREKDPSDKRKSYLSITSNGLSELQRLKSEFSQIASSLFSSLSEEESKELLLLLSKLLDSPDSASHDSAPRQQAVSIRRGTRL